MRFVHVSQDAARLRQGDIDLAIVPRTTSDRLYYLTEQCTRVGMECFVHVVANHRYWTRQRRFVRCAAGRPNGSIVRPVEQSCGLSLLSSILILPGDAVTLLPLRLVEVLRSSLRLAIVGEGAPVRADHVKPAHRWRRARVAKLRSAS